MSDDPEIQRIIQLFDTALTSKDPRVKEALAKLLTITVLIEPDLVPSQNSGRGGPLAGMQRQIEELSWRISQLEMARNNITFPGGLTTTTSGLAPTFTVSLAGSNLPLSGDYSSYSVTSGISAAPTSTNQLDLFAKPVKI